MVVVTELSVGPQLDFPKGQALWRRCEYGLSSPDGWLLVVVWLVAFGCFAVASVLAAASKSTFEYRLYGVQFPYVAFALLGVAGSHGHIVGAAVVQPQGRGL